MVIPRRARLHRPAMTSPAEVREMTDVDSKIQNRCQKRIGRGNLPGDRLTVRSTPGGPMAIRTARRRPLIVTAAAAVTVAGVVLATRSAGAETVTPLPALPPGTTLTMSTHAAHADGSPQPVNTSLTAVLPETGHAFLVIDCAGPSTSTIVVNHRDQRRWSPAAIVDGANHADGSCEPGSERQGYALNGAPAEVVTLDITGDPVTAYRVVVSDTCPCQGSALTVAGR
jgi:hypothetical protein